MKLVDGLGQVWCPGKDWIATAAKAWICKDFEPTGGRLCTGFVYRSQGDQQFQRLESTAYRSVKLIRRRTPDLGAKRTNGESSTSGQGHERK